MEEYHPPYCPNERCGFHVLLQRSVRGVSEGHFFIRYGFYVLRDLKLQRFRCRECRCLFTERTFHFDFRFKKIDTTLSARIFKAFILGASGRQIARHLYISGTCVRGRLERMAQWGMLIHREKLSYLKGIGEAICYDGLENFAGTQYDPNYINQAIGKESLFIYDFNFAPLNRKGKMSDRQKQRKFEIEKKLGAYPKDAIRRATTVIFKRLRAMNPPHEPVVLCTDEHFQYRRSLERDLNPKDFVHQTVSAKKTRNYQNILFAVNHADLLIRQRVAAFTRETISFSKTHAAMCKKFVLFMIHKNYLCPQFTKAQKYRPKANTQSPAEALGIESKILKFYEFFSQKRSERQVRIPEDWKLILDHKVPYERCKYSTYNTLKAA